MSDRPSLADLATEMDCARLSNIAWVGQAEANNPRSHNLPGARARMPVFAETTRWLEKLAALSRAVGGDDARVEAFLDRALAQAGAPVQSADRGA